MARQMNPGNNRSPTGQQPARMVQQVATQGRAPTGQPRQNLGTVQQPRPRAPGQAPPAQRQRRSHDPQLQARVKKAQAQSQKIIEEVNKVIVGKREVLELVQMNIMAGGNVLFEDFPGLAKSLMAMTFSYASGCAYKRIQFTPDLLPSDITGTYIFDQKDVEFKFRPGPVFCNFLLADEINRAPPKTQAALLETMQERQVSVEGQTHKLDKPYVVLATQNPVEQEGTYPLPEAQNDRFLMKLSVGYPNRGEELEILLRRMRNKVDFAQPEPVTTPEEIVSIQKVVEDLHTDEAILQYIVEIIQRTREHPQVYVGSSPRGSLALFKLSRANAVLEGRDYVIPDDVKSVAPHALHHRMILKPEPKIRGIQAIDIVREIVEATPVPTV